MMRALLSALTRPFVRWLERRRIAAQEAAFWALPAIRERREERARRRKAALKGEATKVHKAFTRDPLIKGRAGA